MFDDRKAEIVLSAAKLSFSMGVETKSIALCLAYDIGCLHGSNSGSLIDVVTGGLMPTGLQQNISFTGEMMGGILSGNLNQDRVSVVEPEELRQAIDYARKNLAGWTPEQSSELVKESEHWMRRAGIAESVISEWKVLRYQIEERRITRWQELSALEQQLVSHPFPLVYGIAGDVPIEETKTAVPGEGGIRVAHPDKLTIFAPVEHMESVQNLNRNRSEKCRVECFDLLSDTLLP